MKKKYAKNEKVLLKGGEIMKFRNEFCGRSEYTFESTFPVGENITRFSSNRSFDARKIKENYTD